MEASILLVACPLSVYDVIVTVLMLQCGVVQQGVTEGWPGILMVSSHQIYIFKITGPEGYVTNVLNSKHKYQHFINPYIHGAKSSIR